MINNNINITHPAGLMLRIIRCARRVIVTFIVAVAVVWLLGFHAQQAQNLISQSRGRLPLADLVVMSHVRANQLSGYGLVIGLSGTGDSRTSLARQSMRDLLHTLGQSPQSSRDASGAKDKDDRLGRSRNMAAVLVTVDIPPFMQSGGRLLNATVSSIGDARSLVNGVLVQTPLYAANGVIYAVAQGQLHPSGQGRTVARLSDGTIVERSVNTNIFTNAEKNQVRMTLRLFRISTINQIEELLRTSYSQINFETQGSTIVLDLKAVENPKQEVARLLEESIQLPMRPQILVYQAGQTVLVDDDLSIHPRTLIRFRNNARNNGGNAGYAGSTLNENQLRQLTGVYATLPSAAGNLANRFADGEAGAAGDGDAAARNRDGGTGNSAGNRAGNSAGNSGGDTSSESKQRSVPLASFVRELQNQGSSIEDVIEILQLLRETGGLNADLIIR